MKCLFFETREIEMPIQKTSNRPFDIRSENTPDDFKKFNDIIVAWICVERDDTNKDAELIFKEIKNYHNMIKKKILITPFIHLSNNVSLDHEFNKGIIDYIGAKLSEIGILAGILGYGFHRIIYGKWLTFGNEVSFAFRDSKH